MTKLVKLLLAGAILLTPSAVLAQPSINKDDPEAIRPFRVDFSKADLDDLRRRVAATRWPDQETVPDQSQGVQLATMKNRSLR